MGVCSAECGVSIAKYSCSSVTVDELFDVNEFERSNCLLRYGLSLRDNTRIFISRLKFFTRGEIGEPCVRYLSVIGNGTFDDIGFDDDSERLSSFNDEPKLCE